MSWNVACPRRILHRARHRDRLLDHLRDTIQGRIMVLASALPSDDSRIHSRRWRDNPPLLTSMARVNGRNEEALQSLAKLRSLPTSDRRVRQEYMDILVEVFFAQFVQDNGFRYQYAA
jgi:hypothetical protein